MIFDKQARLLVDDLGWVDRGALWIYDTARHKEKLVAVDDARFLSLQAGEDGLFRVIHWESQDGAISIRRIAEPEVELASIRFRDEEPVFEGQVELWDSVDTAVLVSAGTGYQLLRIDAARRQVINLDLSWYSAANYDLGYQGLVGCLTIPRSHLVIVAVQRSSQLVILDIQTNRPIARLMLADRGGNPVLRIRSAGDLLASDYDTLCRINLDTMALVASRRLQTTSVPNSRLFIGDYDLNPDGTWLVARPSSGDVLLVDSKDFRELSRAPAEGQPLSVCMVSETRVVTRDWKTGQVR